MQRTFSQGTKKILKTAKFSAIFPQKKRKTGQKKTAERLKENSEVPQTEK